MLMEFTDAESPVPQSLNQRIKNEEQNSKFALDTKRSILLAERSKDRRNKVNEGNQIFNYLFRCKCSC